MCLVVQLSFTAFMQDFFSSASLHILEASSQLAVLDNVLVEIPSSWDRSQCGNLPSKHSRPPYKAINIIAELNRPTKAVQHQGCGLQGHMVFLKSSDMLTTSIRNSAGK